MACSPSKAKPKKSGNALATALRRGVSTPSPGAPSDQVRDQVSKDV